MTELPIFTADDFTFPIINRAGTHLVLGERRIFSNQTVSPSSPQLSWICCNCQVVECISTRQADRHRLIGFIDDL